MRLILLLACLALSSCATADKKQPEYSGPFFTIGSSKEEVISVQGSPERITTFNPPSTQEWWHYPDGSVFIEDNLVEGWEGRLFDDRTVRGKLNPTSHSSASKVFQGATLDDVLTVMGSPDGYRPLDLVVWITYGKSRIDMRGGSVVGWENKGDLKL